MEGAHPVCSLHMEAKSPFFLVSAVSMTVEYCKWRPVHLLVFLGCLFLANNLLVATVQPITKTLLLVAPKNFLGFISWMLIQSRWVLKCSWA